MKRAWLLSLFLCLPLAAQYYHVVIDPGHGKWWSGTMGYEERGPAEKWRNLEIALKLKGSLEFYNYYFQVYMTRDRDTALCGYPGSPPSKDSLRKDLTRRAMVANGEWPSASGDTAPYHLVDAFVSIHLNASDNPSVDGQETWYHHNLELAQHVVDSLVAAINHFVCYTDSCGNFTYLASNRGIKYDNDSLMVLDSTYWEIPATLVEVLFYTNYWGWCAVWDDYFKAEAACGIFEGTCGFLNLNLGCIPIGICEDTTPPTCSLIYPNYGDFDACDFLLIHWDAEDPPEPGSEGITEQGLYFSRDGGGNWDL